MAPAASLVLSVLAILFCGALGAFAGYALVRAFDFTGTLGSIVAAAIGMVVATFAWAVGIALLKKLGWLR